MLIDNEASWAKTIRQYINTMDIKAPHEKKCIQYNMKKTMTKSHLLNSYAHTVVSVTQDNQLVITRISQYMQVLSKQYNKTNK
jgi:hypothetical protein